MVAYSPGDMCQALGLHPTRKYESDGGPGVRRIVELLREQSSSPDEDVQSFLDAIAFNWLIAGTDAHAKNYSLLLGQNGVVRLAPLYDLASILPYPAVDMSKVKLAMKIGGTIGSEISACGIGRNLQPNCAWTR
jgi:serine/threonine-protein kinase HipA